jgi:hypothetical protein
MIGGPEHARGPSRSEFALEGGAGGGFVAHGDDMALPVVGGGVRRGGQSGGGPTGELPHLREADDLLVGLLALGAPGHGGGEDLGEAGQVQALCHYVISQAVHGGRCLRRRGAGDRACLILVRHGGGRPRGARGVLTPRRRPAELPRGADCETALVFT